jgi:N-acetylglucosamine-6-phosphate deacetylase
MSIDSGYFDIQVNGYGGVDFNSDRLGAQELRAACRRLRDDGVESVLATVITDEVDAMERRLRGIVKIRETDPIVKSVIAGIHIEGPFLSPKQGYLGAHPADAVLRADVPLMQRLLDAAGGLTRMVTLAPEQDPRCEVIKLLKNSAVAVSAGHTDASIEELNAALDAGLALFTHLGNGCPMLGMHRHDNIIQRVLHLRERFGFISFICDLVHVPAFALKNYMDLVGVDKCIVTSDAIAPAGLGPGRYTLGRWDLQIGEDMVARSPDGSHFVGAAITMKQSEKNLREAFNDDDRALRAMLVDNPRKAVALS